MKFLKLLLMIFLIGCIGFVIGNAILYIYARTTPKLQIRSANSISLYDNNDNLFFQGTGSSKWVPLENISEHLVNATIAIEDKNFYKHNGFDYLRIIKALYINARKNQRLQGASTITQQYAKNLFLSFDKTWKRKWDEMILAIELEVHYDKDEILEGYLNTINYGHGVYGIENASEFYFNKKAKNLTLSEASLLAGIPNWPAGYSPLIDELEAKKRQNLVLSVMVKNNYITEKQKNNALEDNLVYVGKKNNSNLSTIMYYQDAVIKELKKINIIPESFIETGGLKVYTNLDIKAQTALDESVEKNLKDNIDIQTAAVMIEPSTGKIIALTGGRDYSMSQYNRATDSKRQVGSSIKPFLYYSALENGFTASTNFISEPTTFTFSDNKTYSPSNYGGKYPGKPISLAIALAYSDNIYAVKTHLFLGEETLVKTLKRVGLKEKVQAIPSLALGSEELNVIDFTSAYATLANNGYKIDPYLITRVEDAKGNVLYRKNPTKEGVLNPSLTFILSELLANTYAYDLIDYGSPTCISIASRLTKKYAIKSGTTDSDSWAVGYNKDVVMATWSGYDDNKDLISGDGKYSKYIWADTIETYLKDKENNWYDIPDNVVGLLVNPITGTPIKDTDERKKVLYYIKGTEPTYERNSLDNLIKSN
ncbi:MAG: PBP1A family penicillin-binding protein [Bacilli bacterium]